MLMPGALKAEGLYRATKAAIGVGQYERGPYLHSHRGEGSGGLHRIFF